LKRRYLTPVAAGEAMFSYCLSEPEAGSDAVSMTTRAVRDGDHWVLNGVKRWITNAGESEYYTVFAVTDPAARSRGISAFVVEKGDPGVSFGAPEKKLGIKGSPTREVYLDNVRIPADRLIGAEGTGFATAMRTLDHTRVTIAAQAIGIAQGALDYAKGYVKERKQFGRPIADFQAVQLKLAEMAMQVEAARLLIWRAAQNAEDGLPSILDSSLAKCFANEMVREVCGKALQLFGAYGYAKEFGMEQRLRDAWGWGIAGGTIDIQKVNIASALVGRRFDQRRG
jgi:alkylation response protein AidB-like acyl-CoA dehydrogenase